MIAATGPMSRRELWLWVVALVTINIVVHDLDLTSVGAAVTSAGSLNLIMLFALVVLVERTWSADAAAPAPALEIAAAVLIGAAWVVLSLFGTHSIMGLALTPVGLLLLLRARPGGAQASAHLFCAGQILLFLSMALGWSQVIKYVLAPLVLPIDALLVEASLALTQPDVVRSGLTFVQPGGHGIFMVGACSSFNNISLGALCIGSAVLARRDRLMARDWGFVAAGMAAVVAINAARITAMAASPEGYAFWHDGAGAGIVGIAQTGLLALIAFAAAMAPSPAKRICAPA